MAARPIVGPSRDPQPFDRRPLSSAPLKDERNERWARRRLSVFGGPSRRRRGNRGKRDRSNRGRSGDLTWVVQQLHASEKALLTTLPRCILTPSPVMKKRRPGSCDLLSGAASPNDGSL